MTSLLKKMTTRVKPNPAILWARGDRQTIFLLYFAFIAIKTELDIFTLL
jgi:hypothetical protein